MPRLKTYARRLFWVLLALYFLIAAGLLAVRYLVLPQIDSFRPAMVRAASQSLGLPVRIGAVQADWRGVNAHLALSDVEILTDEGVAAVRLPQVDAVLSWRSLLRGEPMFLYLEVRGLSLDLTRDAQGRIGLSGVPAGAAQNGDADQSARVLRWLGRQREWVLRDAQLNWRDQRVAQGEAALQVQGLQARFLNRFSHHAFGIQAQVTTDPALAPTELALRGELDRRWFEALSQRPNWDARFYASVQHADATAWRRWLAPLTQAEPRALQALLSGQAWAQWHDGKWSQVALDASFDALDWQGEGIALQAERAQVYLDGAPAAVLSAAQRPGWMLAPRPEQGLYVDARLTQAKVDWAEEFAGRPWTLTQAQWAGELQAHSEYGWAATIRRLALQTPDLTLAAAGRWHALPDSDTGWLDLSGSAAHLALPALHQYFPDVVDAETRDWLARAFGAGVLRDTALTLRGDLDAFPFETPAQADGPQFELRGRFEGMDLDYAPADRQSKGWPPIVGAAGQMHLLQNQLTLTLNEGQLVTAANRRLNLADSTAQIDDLYREAATLQLDAQASGAAPSFLAMLPNSALGALLADTVLPQSRAQGDWGLKLQLHVPLLHSVDSTVNGQLALQGSTVVLRPDIPAFEALQGVLAFDEGGIAAQGLRGRFMGGAFQLSGALNHAQPEATLSLQGTMSASSLARWLPPAALARFDGALTYQAALGLDAAGELWMRADSSLQGMQLDFPAPLGKPASARRALSASWQPGPAGSAVLRAHVGGVGTLLLDHDPAREAAYFWRGSLRDAQAGPASEAAGMRLDLTTPEVDWPAWDQVITDFDEPGQGGRPLMPPLAALAVQTAQLDAVGTRWQQVALQASTPTSGRWQLRVDGPQLAGDLDWDPQAGKHGRLQARFAHLAWPQAPAPLPASAQSAGQDWTPAADWRLPDLDIQVQDLTWHEFALGALRLQGHNRDAQGDWTLSQLQLAQPGATLTASGGWTPAGEQAGLALKAVVTVQDLGQWLGAWGLEDTVGGGHGRLQADLRWRALPWRQTLEDLHGTLQVTLEQGRFVHMRSRSARVLEVLSLQSLSRVLTLEANPVDAFKAGFPFDEIVGDVSLAGAALHIERLRVVSPVAEIVLRGGTDLVQQRWDMTATVTPNLDVSGAALATGFVVNPVVGVGAFLAQWLLKDPLARALKLEYHVGGSWDDPAVTPVQGPPASRPSTARAHPEGYVRTGN